MEPTRPNRGRKTILGRSRTAQGSGRAAGDPESSGVRFERMSRWAAPMLVALVATGVLSLSWPYGPDSLVDFGRELYIPWRIAAGDTLYVDLAYLNGPLSPYWNALLFHVFGVGLRTLMVANAACAGLLAVLLYALFSAAANRLAATVACLAFVAFLAFTQLGDQGNYNYLTPYSHEITHGLLLALSALFAFAQRQRFGDRALTLSGLCLGLVFLTKVEVFLAASAGLAAAWSGMLWVERRSGRDSLRLLTAFAAAALAPVVCAFVLMLLAMPASAAFRALTGPFAAVLNAEVVESPFYQWVRGTERLPANLWWMGVWLARYVLFALPLAALGLSVRTRGRWGWAAAGGAFVAVCAAGAVLTRGTEWPQAVRALPVVLPLLAAGVSVRLLRARVDGTCADLLVLRLALIVFAFVLLAKIFFNTWLYHYGFALAMPGTLVLIAAMLAWIPEWIDRQGGFGGVFIAGALGILVVAGHGLVEMIGARHEGRAYRVGQGADAFLDGPRAVCVAQVVDHLARRMAVDETLTVLPEGVMINYLARRRGSTPYTNFMPIEIVIEGERRILAALERNPSDFVVVAHKDTSEYGLPLFGRDYGVALYNWVKANYTLVGRCGAPPLRELNAFGIDILERSDRVQSGSSSPE